MLQVTSTNVNQNILIASRDPLWIKLADFGTSKRTNNTFLRTRCGTHGYLAPEVQGLLPRTIAAGEAFSNALDMWSLGCILHELLTSQIPFLDVTRDLGDDELSGISEFESGGVTFFDIDMNMLYGYCQGKADFPSEILVKSDVAKDVIEFVKSLLIANPSLRATVVTALQNPWVTNTGYISTWFVELQREFTNLGVELDLGRDRALMMRQLRSTDIALVLPSTTDVPILLQQALVKRYHSAALALIKSSAWVTNPTAVLVLAKQLVSDGRIEFVKSLIPVLPAGSLDSGELLQLAVGGGQVEMVRLLLEKGANVDTLINGRTSLQAAVELGSVDMVRVLLDSKSDVNTKSSEGQTALHMAIARGAVELIKLLLENKADVNIKSSNGETALHMAIARENVELVKLFLENKADVNIKSNDGQTSLYMAAMCESTEVVNALLDNKAYINAKHIAGQTPLRVAAGGGHLDYAILLLRQNVDINAKSGDGRTALQTAAGGGHTEMVQLLLKHGADINAKLFRIDGGTALRTAASAGHLEMVKLLLSKGADIDAESGRGRTALQAAARRGHLDVVRYLVENNADTNTNSSGVVGQTALRSGARSGHCHIVHFLLMHGANVNGGSSECRTALQEAAGRGHFDVVKLLVDNHADINCSPSGVVGQTALQAAAGSGHFDVVEFLLGRGADANVRSGDGRTALQAATEGGYVDIVAKLMEGPKPHGSINGPPIS